jgi:hypothetical protein
MTKSTADKPDNRLEPGIIRVSLTIERGSPEETASSEIKQLYVYADETEFEVQTQTRPLRRVGYGILITTEAIDEVVVSEALEQLSADPDRHDDRWRNMDERTLARGRFHAAEDSKNGHSHLCRAIRSRINGTFVYNYFEPDHPRAANRDVDQLQEQMLQYGMLSLHFTRLPIRVVVEQRSGLRRIEHPAWLEQLFKMSELCIYAKPSIPCVYPNMHIAMGSKADPGIQVVDFLLWACNRSRRIQNDDLGTPDDTWVLRSGLVPMYGRFSAHSPERGGEYRLNREVPDQFFNYPLVKVPESMGSDKLLQVWCVIEQFIHWAGVSGALPDHAEHLWRFANRASSALRQHGERVGYEIVVEAASCFLKLFDTVPFYHDVPSDDTEQWEWVLFVRRMAGLVQLDELTNGVEVANHWCRFRRQQLKLDPGQLGLLSGIPDQAGGGQIP